MLDTLGNRGSFQLELRVMEASLHLLLTPLQNISVHSPTSREAFPRAIEGISYISQSISSLYTLSHLQAHPRPAAEEINGP